MQHPPPSSVTSSRRRGLAALALCAVLTTGAATTARADAPAGGEYVASATTAGHRLQLPAVSRSADDRPWRSFMSSPGLSLEAIGMFRGGWGDADGIGYLRAMANTRLGPLALGVGAIVGGETQFNVHLEIFSYESAGWAFGIGAGLADGGTLRFAIPIVDGLRGRVMASFGPLGASGGLGLEVEPW